jgi:hypothetical protein
MDIVEEQLQAYNARDLERFMAAYSSEIVIEDGEGRVMMEGDVHMRRRYGDLFAASPELHCRIVNRLRIGKYVVDEEEVSGWQGSPEPLRAVAIYRVEGGKIAHVCILT